MNTKPILFSAEMIRALLDGRKTQTRWVLKPQPDGELPIGGAEFVEQGQDARWCWLNGWDGSIIDTFSVPYAVGDLLWVREAWRTCVTVDGEKPSDLVNAPVRMEADVDIFRPQRMFKPGRIRPSMFMPRQFSRMTLKVTDVRVQRVQDIDVPDAVAEGAVEEREIISVTGGPNGPIEEYGYRSRVPLIHDDHETGFDDPVEAFRDLWDSINAKPKPRYRHVDDEREITHYESYPWGGENRIETFRGKPHHITANPWVAAYTFELIRKNRD